MVDCTSESTNLLYTAACEKNIKDIKFIKFIRVIVNFMYIDVHIDIIIYFDKLV